jgi:VCBS repeat-containing protein
VEVAVLVVKSAITISAGWAYESGAAAGGEDNPNADPNGWGYGNGAASFTHVSVGGNIVIAGSAEDYENGLIQASGQLSWLDGEGDDIASISVGGVSLPSSGSITVQGTYGTLLVNADGSYAYTLLPGMDAAGIDGEEVFAVVAADIYGATSSENLTVTLKPLTHTPVCADLNMDWQYAPNGAPTTVVNGGLVFSDVDMGYAGSTETLSLQVNGIAVPDGGSCAIVGEYGMLTISSDGQFFYTPANGCFNQPHLEHFAYTVTDKTGNSSGADLYIRLSDTAPDFPNIAATQAESQGGEEELAGIMSLSAYGNLLGGDDEEAWGDNALSGGMPFSGSEDNNAFHSSGYDVGENTDLPAGLSDILDFSEAEQTAFESLLTGGSAPGASTASADAALLAASGAGEAFSDNAAYQTGAYEPATPEEEDLQTVLQLMSQFT